MLIISAFIFASKFLINLNKDPPSPPLDAGDEHARELHDSALGEALSLRVVVEEASGHDGEGELLGAAAQDQVQVAEERAQVGVLRQAAHDVVRRLRDVLVAVGRHEQLDQAGPDHDLDQPEREGLHEDDAPAVQPFTYVEKFKIWT